MNTSVERGPSFSYLFDQRYDPARWNQAAHIRYWGMSSHPETDRFYAERVDEHAVTSARGELAKIRPSLLRNGVIDLGCGIYPEESFRILSGGDTAMRYVGVDDFGGIKEPARLFAPVGESEDSSFLWPKTKYPRPLNAGIVQVDMVEFLHTFFEKSDERVHFFINGHDEFLHYDKVHQTPEDTITELEKAQPGSIMFGFSDKGGILHLMRSNPAFELMAHFPAGKSDDGFLFFQKE